MNARTKARGRLALLVVLSGGCVEFPHYVANPSNTPTVAGQSCFEILRYQPAKRHHDAIDQGVQRTCELLHDPRLDALFEGAFGGELVARPLGCDEGLEMVSGTDVLTALRAQSPDWTVHVFVVPRGHELARSDYAKTAVSLTPRRLKSQANFVETFGHELTHLVETPFTVTGDSQWFKDRGHRNAEVKTRQFASYFVGNALRCAHENPNVSKNALIECAQGSDDS